MRKKIKTLLLKLKLLHIAILLRDKIQKVLRFRFGYYGKKIILIGDISLTIDNADGGGRLYISPSSYEEYSDPLYDQIAADFNPELIIDVGANYGFTGLVFEKKFPGADIILVEPSTRLCDFIKHNFEKNGVQKYKIVQAACGEFEETQGRFFLNPESSQDNRVSGEIGWKIIRIPTKTLGMIIDESNKSGNIFIKIDTQGSEERVFRGAKDFLSKHTNWLIKAEYAPFCLDSQGTNPLEFLRYLITNYIAIEAPSLCRFNRGNLPLLFSEPLTIDESEAFLSHTIGLDKNDTGWCDLLIKPKG